MRTLVTGAAGFIGTFVCQRLLQEGHAVRAVIRSHEQRSRLPEGCEAVSADLATVRDWQPLLEGVEQVLHLAAKVHDVTYRSAADMDAYAAANTAPAVGLANAAARAGVRAFVFASTIKVNGESTAPGHALTAADAPAADPRDAYAVSKWRAEQEIRRLAETASMRMVIVRPPLVYGPGATGNLLRLLRWVAAGRPLPFAAISNRRSLIYVENLADLMVRCLSGSAAPVVLATDGPPLSTPALIREMASALGVPARLFPVPAWALQAAGSAMGKGQELQRLLGSLEIDCAEPARALGWRPPVERALGMRKTAGWFRSMAHG